MWKLSLGDLYRTRHPRVNTDPSVRIRITEFSGTRYLHLCGTWNQNDRSPKGYTGDLTGRQDNYSKQQSSGRILEYILWTFVNAPSDFTTVPEYEHSRNAVADAPVQQSQGAANVVERYSDSITYSTHVVDSDQLAEVSHPDRNETRQMSTTAGESIRTNNDQETPCSRENASQERKIIDGSDRSEERKETYGSDRSEERKVIDKSDRLEKREETYGSDRSKERIVHDGSDQPEEHKVSDGSDRSEKRRETYGSDRSKECRVHDGSDRSENRKEPYGSDRSEKRIDMTMVDKKSNAPSTYHMVDDIENEPTDETRTRDDVTKITKSNVKLSLDSDHQIVDLPSDVNQASCANYDQHSYKEQDKVAIFSEHSFDDSRIQKVMDLFFDYVGDSLPQFSYKMKPGPKCKGTHRRVVVLPCIISSRMGSDVRSAVTKSQIPGDVRLVMLLFHPKSPNSDSKVYPSRKLSFGSDSLDERRIDSIDVLFWHGDVYRSQHNKNSIEDFIRVFTE